VELVVAVEERFGIRLPVMELSETSSIAKLTVRILELLRGSQDAEAAPVAEDNLQALTLARHGAELSEAELAQVRQGARDPDSQLSRLIN
jgi:hypothetical protein